MGDSEWHHSPSSSSSIDGLGFRDSFQEAAWDSDIGRGLIAFTAAKLPPISITFSLDPKSRWIPLDTWE